MDAAPGPGKPKMIRCPHCGAENREDAAFCSLCLTRFDVPAEPEDTGTPAADPQTESDAGPTPTPDAAEPQPRPTEPHPSDERPMSTPSPEEDRAWSDAVAAFSADDVPADIADLPPEIQMELMRPSSTFDMRKLWMRAAIAISLSVVAIAVAVGILAMMINERASRSAQQQQSQQQVAPQAVTPTQPQPTPGGPESHPDLGFSVPAGWGSGGTADNILLTGPNGESIEIRSWERGADGRYLFTSGQLNATSEGAAVAEMANPLLQTVYGGSAPATAPAVAASVGSVRATMAEMPGAEDQTAGTDTPGGQGQRYVRAYGFAHGNWTYMALGIAPLGRESDLTSAMQSLLESVAFKQ